MYHNSRNGICHPRNMEINVINKECRDVCEIRRILNSCTKRDLLLNISALTDLCKKDEKNETRLAEIIHENVKTGQMYIEVYCMILLKVIKAIYKHKPDKHSLIEKCVLGKVRDAISMLENWKERMEVHKSDPYAEEKDMALITNTFEMMNHLICPEIITMKLASQIVGVISKCEHKDLPIVLCMSMSKHAHEKEETSTFSHALDSYLGEMVSLRTSKDRIHYLWMNHKEKFSLNDT